MIGTDASLAPNLLLYFLYGLAFFYLGVAIATKDMRESRLTLAASLWLLAVFGLTHGLHEWLELYSLLLPDRLAAQDLGEAKGFKLLALLLSFCFLLFFGLRLSVPRRTWRYGLAAVWLLLWLGFVAPAWGGDRAVLLQQAERFGRLFLGGSGGALTAYGLIAYSTTLRSLNQPVARNFAWAGVMFAVYALHAGFIPSHTRLPPFLLPVEVMRALSAVGITYFIVRGLNIFDLETRRKVERQMKTLAQSEKLASLGRLAAGVAHEINNPLTNVSLNVELLKKEFLATTDPARVEKRFAAIERNIDRASRIARELLHFSRQKEEALLPTDLNRVITDSLILLGNRAQEYRIETRLLPLPPVMAMAVKVEEVLLNILLNAMDASPPNGLITIGTRAQHGEVLVAITDQGAGIAPEHVNQAMEPFYTTKEVGQGTGLGLSICYGIMELFQGKIELISTVGIGTTVQLVFPAAATRRGKDD